MSGSAGTIEEIGKAVTEGHVIPYLGPGLFRGREGVPFPIDSRGLADWLSARVSIPGRIRGNATAVAQYIENFKHRKTLTRLMEEAFAPKASPTPVHRFLAALPHLPLVVDTWYDGTLAGALSDTCRQGRAFGHLSGVSRSEHPNQWFRYTGRCDDPEAAEGTILYKPHGGVDPEPHFLVSDSDYVEVLTEIDIQTPIPPVVQRLRTGRHFLFLGCRFHQQLDRIFARQIMKRSSERHWVVFDPDGKLSKKEARFLEVQLIVPVWVNPDLLIEGLPSLMAATA